MHYLYYLCTTQTTYALLILLMHYLYCLCTTYTTYALLILLTHYLYHLCTTYATYALLILLMHYLYHLRTTYTTYALLILLIQTHFPNFKFVKCHSHNYVYYITLTSYRTLTDLIYKEQINIEPRYNYCFVVAYLQIL